MPDVQFAFHGLDEWRDILNRWRPSVRKKTGDAMRKISVVWQTEARKRVPVDTGLTRNTILRESGVRGNGEFFAAVGSNQKHAPFIEFGTAKIAKGRVRALGDRQDVTDAEAIHAWPAKEAYHTDRTTVQFDTRLNRRRDVKGRFASVGEQMPWLRPAFMKIEEKALALLAKAMLLD